MFDSDENFVEIGTALEPLEEEEVPKKKPVNISDQIVVDENGRRRFHGAFTGGFSAGYYNTVGSKEGWEPATFKSTRSDRFSQKNQNIHDFMDEEDMGAFGIAPQILRTTGDFDKKESRKRTKATPSDGPIPGEPVLEMIIQPVRDTVGMRILQRMGWRPGQGVGPRKENQERKTNRANKGKKTDSDAQNVMLDDATIESVDLTSKVYGCALPTGAIPGKGSAGEDSTDSDEDNFQENVLFAPQDIDSPLCNPKVNTYGLGYSGLDRNALAFGHGHIDLFGGSELKFRVENKKLNIRGEAFGIGAFEDEDEEVYSREDISQYDFALETQDERKSRLAKEKLLKKTKGSKDDAIPGFTRAKHPPAPRKYFPPPPLPKNFEPTLIKRKSRFEPAAERKEEGQLEHVRKRGLDRHNLTLEERQVLLGEAKERISAGKSADGDTSEEVKVVNNEQLQKEKTERLTKFAEVLQQFSANKVNQTDSLGRPCFKPFMKNPEKQDRYEKYMTLVAAGYKECLKDLQPLDMTEWQREREKMEFERASALYKPISEVMSSRFVSAQSHDISHVVPIKEVAQVKDPNQDPKVAAKMNLFGKLTHQIHEWHPDRLLCKRLNVPHPYPDSKMVGVRKVTTAQPASSEIPGKVAPPAQLVHTPVEAVKRSLFDNIDFSKPPPGLLPPGTSLANESSEPPPPGTEEINLTSSMQVAPPSTSLVENSPETEPVTISRPPIDLFKEIFADTSSESEDEREVVPSPTKSRHIPQDNTKSNYSRFEKPSEKNNGVKGRQTASQIKDAHDQKASSNSAQPSLNSGRNPNQPTQINMKGNRTPPELQQQRADESEEEYVYGPKPPSATTSFTIQEGTTTAIPKTVLSNPLMRTNVPESKFEGEAEWVEKGKDLFPSKKSNKSSSSHHHHHKSKKSKEKQKSKHKTKKEKRKSKSKHKDRSRTRSKSRKNDGRERSKDLEDEDTDSSSASSPVQIHQSLSNKALLSKLKELAR